MSNLSLNNTVLRLVRDVNNIQSSLRRVTSNLPLFDIANENTPAQLTTDQNNYVPGNYDILRLSSSADVTITGFAGGVKGRSLKLFNVGSFAITLADGNTGSLPANRLRFSTGVGAVILPGSSFQIYYDSTQERWIENLPLEDANVSKEATPAQITTDQDNYDPSDYGVLRLSSSADITITGFQGGVKGRFLHIYNVGSFIITLAHQSTDSDAENRLISPSELDIKINSGGGVTLYYDSTQQRWISSPYNSNANRLRKTGLSRGADTVPTYGAVYAPDWTTVIRDDGGWFDSGSPKWVTVDQDGVYLPWAYFRFSGAGGTGFWFIRIYFLINGSFTGGGSMATYERDAFSKFITAGGSPLDLTAGDEVAAVLEHNYGSNASLLEATFTLLQVG